MPMTEAEKVFMAKQLMRLENKSTEDSRIAVFLEVAGREIISWRYSYFKGEKPVEVPPEYEMIQIYAIVAGYSQIGAENETSHSENGTSRTFHYSDMMDYIHAHVIPYAGVG